MEWSVLWATLAPSAWAAHPTRSWWCFLPFSSSLVIQIHHPPQKWCPFCLHWLLCIFKQPESWHHHPVPQAWTMASYYKKSKDSHHHPTPWLLSSTHSLEQDQYIQLLLDSLTSHLKYWWFSCSGLCDFYLNFLCPFINSLPHRSHYREFSRCVCQFRHIMLLKCGGLAHIPLPFSSSPFGSCAVECPCCPHPGHNILSNLPYIKPENKSVAHYPQSILCSSILFNSGISISLLWLWM